MSRDLFPEMPADGASRDDAQAALDAALAVAKRIRDRDTELIGDLSAADLHAEAVRGVQLIETLRAQLAAEPDGDDDAPEGDTDADTDAGEDEPAAAEADEADAATDAATEVEAEADDTEGADTDEAEPVADAADVLEPVLAAATKRGKKADEAEQDDEPQAEAAAVEQNDEQVGTAPSSTPSTAPKGTTVMASVPPATPQTRQPADRPMGVTVTAAANMGRYNLGAELGRLDIAQAMIDRHRHLGTSGVSDRLPVAVIAAGFPTERTLGQDPFQNYERIMEVVEPDAIIAAGGLCAPCEPYYGLENLTGAQRPVRDSMAAFGANRGCVVHIPPPSLASALASAGSKTMAEDSAPATRVKSCMEVPCTASQTVELGIRYHCLEFSNVPAATWPEHVAHYNDLSLSAQARLAESLLLDAIEAGSTAVTGPTPVGGTWTSIPAQVLAVVAGLKSRHRIRPGVRYRALFPAWMRDVMDIDALRHAFGGFTAPSFEAWADEHGVSITWYEDSSTAGAQLMTPQTAGAMVDFPDNVVWYLYPEGAWLFLDGMTMELGLVRDSALNLTNRFQVFGESLEGAMLVGPESLSITSAICATGETGGSVALSCAAGATAFLS